MSRSSITNCPACGKLYDESNKHEALGEDGMCFRCYDRVILFQRLESKCYSHALEYRVGLAIHAVNGKEESLERRKNQLLESFKQLIAEGFLEKFLSYPDNLKAYQTYQGAIGEK